jgi:predicted nucleotidyltransferase
MKTFDSIINKAINESIVDISRNSIDPSVFEFPDTGLPILHPAIKEQIINDIHKIDEIIHVVDFYLCGSILTRKYSPTSDIDVNVHVNSDDNVEKEKALMLLKQINGRLAAGTTHPVNYFIMEGKIDFSKFNGVYDIENERWRKEPVNVEIDLDNYMKKFDTEVSGMDTTVSELRRDIIDYQQLQQLRPEQVTELHSRLSQKIKEIEVDIEELIGTYDRLKTTRKTMFNKTMSPEDIKKYGMKAKLPANVIFKMLERYYYFDFVNQIKRIYGEQEKITAKDILRIKTAGKDLWK